MSKKLPGSKVKLILFGAAAGLVYGLLLRGSSQFFQHPVVPVMSLALTALVPFGMGFLSVFLVERRESQPIWVWMVLPLLPFAGGLVATMLALWEGIICVIIFAPIGMGLAIVGGVAGGLVAGRIKPAHFGNFTLACVMILPLVISPWEQRILAQRDLRWVETAIDIQAPPATVWKQIERVSPIRSAELRPSWTRRIGFPSPVEATLSFEGIGGVRHASFEGGVVFVETVDVWDPQQRLSFSIHAQTAQIPKTTLDEHVTIGGQFFDVLRGEYRLEPLSNGVTRLHLSSQHRLSTDFNWYARLWTDAIMADLQNTILLVVRNRCQADYHPK